MGAAVELTGAMPLARPVPDCLRGAGAPMGAHPGASLPMPLSTRLLRLAVRVRAAASLTRPAASAASSTPMGELNPGETAAAPASESEPLPTGRGNPCAADTGPLLPFVCSSGDRTHVRRVSDSESESESKS